MIEVRKIAFNPTAIRYDTEFCEVDNMLYITCTLEWAGKEFTGRGSNLDSARDDAYEMARGR